VWKFTFTRQTISPIAKYQADRLFDVSVRLNQWFENLFGLTENVGEERAFPPRRGKGVHGLQRFFHQVPDHHSPVRFTGGNGPVQLAQAQIGGLPE
jgi:hypothetical protein